MPERVSKAFTYDGKRYYVKGKTEAEALRKKNEKLSALMAGKVQDSAVRFDIWFRKYIDVYKSRVSEKTRADYLQLYEKAIAPTLGEMSLKSIKQINCRELLNALEGKSKSYVSKVYILLNGALEAAVDNDLLNKNPMRGLQKPDAVAGHRRALTPEERDTFLKAADLCGDAGYYGKIVYFCGLRPSEANRVRAEDFDRSNRLLRVRGTKTRSAVRSVPVPMALPLPDKRQGLLFTTRYGGERDKEGQQRWWMKLKLAMENVSGGPVADDLTMYCLRHDFGTRCIEAGIDIETVSKMMGHSNVSITSKVYLHESEATLKTALEKMNVLYG